MVIFNSYVTNYQRVASWTATNVSQFSYYELVNGKDDIPFL